MGYNKICLYGNQTCDYLYIQSDAVDKSKFEAVNSEPSEWSDTTLLLAKFNSDLVAGNSSLTTDLVGYEVRRRSGISPHTKYIGTIKDTSQLKQKYMMDYSIVNNTAYTYYLYPSSSANNNGVILSPCISNEVKNDWGYWSLLIVDETEEENVFYLDKLFKFELNLQTDDINNNATVSVIQNFTPYPTVQYGTSNYWSGGLTALCGFISSNDVDYIQTPNMINELKSLTSDSRRKFLKDMDGNIWEVKITAPITISTNDQTLERIKSVKISWTEVADASEVSIINNPDKSSASWLLTERGEVIPYVEYIWDEQYRWDDSYIWTAKEDILKTDMSNIGRDLNSKEAVIRDENME